MGCTNHTRSDAASPVLKRRNRRVIQKNFRKIVGIKSLRTRIACQHTGYPPAMTMRGQLRGGAIDAAPPLRKRLQLSESGIEESQTSRKCTALNVVIRGGKLDEALKKKVNVGLRLEPDRLPRLMRVPELAVVEVLETSPEMGFEVDHAVSWLRGCSVSQQIAVRLRDFDNRATSRPQIQSPALVPRRSVSHIAVVKSAVVPVPPMSRVRCSGPESSTLTIASSIRFAAPDSPMW
ncbi:MAG: hypothetical protein QOC81_636 [Thermoanaerobaculia bacterium]|nr:hypothetical protein [Thermoanaerobaculia bacterium]